MKKAIMVLAAAVISAAAAVAAFAGTGMWMQNDYGYWWQRTDGSYRFPNGNGSTETAMGSQSATILTHRDTWTWTRPSRATM